MSTLMSRGAILALSRISNFAIVVLSPLILVRLLNVDDYGRFQEFMLYAALVMAFSELHIDPSLTYFVPKSPTRARAIVSHTSVVVLLLSICCVAALLLARPLIVQFTSYDFVLPLACYIFCFVNLNWLEYFWIATRRADLVLYYTAGRLILRVGILLVVAYATRDVMMMLWAIVAAEAARLLAVAAYLLHARMFTSAWTIDDVMEQLRFSAPIGASSIVQSTGRNIGKLFVASYLGPVALAHYSVGSYLLPLVRLIRGSIADTIFPELVKNRQNIEATLRLWQRTNVIYCALLFPTFTVLSVYGDVVVTTLFTSEYLPALPVFHIYMLFLLRRCFNLDVLLRSDGRTGFVLIGSTLALATNVVLLLVLHKQLGFVGPAVAFIASEIVLELYYATRVRRTMHLPFRRLVDWKSIASIALGCLVGLPFLAAANLLPVNGLAGVVLTAPVFIATTWFVAYRMGVTDIGKLASFFFAPLIARLRS